jgi:hypothetical protein
VRTAGNAEHGWQVLLGADPSGLQFIADEEDWRETFELQHHKWSVQKGPQPTIFVREVISKTSESTVNVNRAKTAQQAADLSIQATPVELQEAMNAAHRAKATPTAAAKAKVPNTAGKSAKGAKSVAKSTKETPPSRASGKLPKAAAAKGKEPEVWPGHLKILPFARGHVHHSLQLTDCPPLDSPPSMLAACWVPTPGG